MPNKFTCDDIGLTIPVQVTVGDRRCNQVTQTTNVKIYDNVGPIARCKTTPTTVYLNSSGATNTLAVSDLDNGSTGNCLSNKSLSISTFNCNHLGDNVVGCSQNYSGSYHCKPRALIDNQMRNIQNELHRNGAGCMRESISLQWCRMQLTSGLRARRRSPCMGLRERRSARPAPQCCCRPRPARQDCDDN